MIILCFCLFVDFFLFVIVVIEFFRIVGYFLIDFIDVVYFENDFLNVVMYVVCGVLFWNLLFKFVIRIVCNRYNGNVLLVLRLMLIIWIILGLVNIF